MAYEKQQPTAGLPTTEQLILRSAGRGFLERGFDGARTTSIARAAEVIHAALTYKKRS